MPADERDTQLLPLVAAEARPGLEPDDCMLQTDLGGFRGPRGTGRSEQTVTMVRQTMQRIGLASLCYFAVVTLWWAVEAGGPRAPGFGVVVVGLVFALANLVSLFVFIALDDERPDSHAYMTELVAAQQHVERSVNRPR